MSKIPDPTTNKRGEIKCQPRWLIELGIKTETKFFGLNPIHPISILRLILILFDANRTRTLSLDGKKFAWLRKC